MFTSFHIERFRGIPVLDIEGVKPVTLVVGKNNSGKTSALEAIFLLCGATSPYGPTLLAQLRGQRIASAPDADAAWRSFFHGMAPQRPIVIAGSCNGEVARRLEITTELSPYSVAVNGHSNGIGEVTAHLPSAGLVLRYTSAAYPTPVVTNAGFDPQGRDIVSLGDSRQDFVPAVFLPSRLPFHLWRDTEHYSGLVRLRREREVVDVLRLVDPRLRGLAVVSEGRAATVYADLGDEALIPLSVCGEGMVRLFSIVLDILSVSGGLYLIDEIDNGLHHSVMKQLWPVLRTLCTARNVQLIATTHNDEMIRDALTTFRDDYTQLALVRLDRTASGLRATTYDGDAMEGALDMHWEVRG